ncbi:MAG: hypothetical protein HC881_10375 [Leptolyngbyaceae cyanobacterium SL_7_1]|nr:hypothetical protein [Leptolyngbyaceae cyanobacterium SL_7_1]
MKTPHIAFQPVHQPISTDSAQSKLTASSPSFWQRFLNQLRQGSTIDSQLRVTQKRDRAGNDYYQIYDSCSGQTHTFLSEMDAIVWLDQQRSKG